MTSNIKNKNMSQFYSGFIFYPIAIAIIILLFYARFANNNHHSIFFPIK